MRAVFGDQLHIISLKEAGIGVELDEPFETLEKNASEKSRTANKISGMNCFSEDSGLEVEAMHGEPGVRTARYAGIASSARENMEKLLLHLKDQPNRSAQFRAVISLVIDQKEYFFEGICRGTIAWEMRGHDGFGYDPVFIPEGDSRTFAEMGQVEKNRFSHRKRAAEKLMFFLRQNALF